MVSLMASSHQTADTEKEDQDKRTAVQLALGTLGE